MAGKLITCIIVALALIQPFNTLPAAENQQEVLYRNAKGELFTKDGILVNDDYPIYWRPKNVKSAKEEHVVIVEPTITYTRHAEYQPAPASFKSSPNERESDFRPSDGRGRSESQVAYYPYYFRSSSSDRNEVDERRRVEERRIVDASDPAYQRFVPREDGNRKWYYYSESSPSPPPPPPTPTVSSKSSVRFYFPNGTAIRTYYNEDAKQVMDIHPNQYVIQVTEMTTSTTPRPETTTVIDCPPYQSCNTVVYQPPQCCKCYFVANRCCPCNYNTNSNNK
jgi:hypothetical protein